MRISTSVHSRLSVFIDITVDGLGATASTNQRKSRPSHAKEVAKPASRLESHELNTPKNRRRRERFRGLIVAIHPQDALNERFALLSPIED